MATPQQLTTKTAITRNIEVGDRVTLVDHEEHGVAVVTELSAGNDTACIRFYCGDGIEGLPVSDHLQLAPPPTASSPVLDLIVPPGSKQPEDMTFDELAEALYALGDCPEIFEIMPWSKSWRADRAFDNNQNRRTLAGYLRYFRDVLKLGFGIAIAPGEVTVAELEVVAAYDGSLVVDALHDVGTTVADALHSAGVDFGMHEFPDDGPSGITCMRSFISEVCVRGKLGLVKKAIAWGAYSEALVMGSAYFAASNNTKDASEIMALLVDECGLDVNFNRSLIDNDDAKSDMKGDMYRLPLLSIAVMLVNVEVVRVLLNRGAIVDYVNGFRYENSNRSNSPLKVAVCMCCDQDIASERASGCLEMVDLLLRHGASMRVRTGGRETRDESCANNILSHSILLPPRERDGSSNVAVLVKLLKVGKPQVEVVEEAIELTDVGGDPICRRLLEDYLRGKPVCCDLCEKRVCEGGGALKLCACRAVSYCGRECQERAWKEHRKVCGLKEGGGSEALVKKREHRKNKEKTVCVCVRARGGSKLVQVIRSSK
jgi:hypothetical protein